MPMTAMSPLISSLVHADKATVLQDSAQYWNPDKVHAWAARGVDLVIGRREGYHLYDMSGHRLIDLHLNGGTYNLGHRNPEIIAELKEALDHFDMGNHHFPAIGRAALSKRLIETAPANMRYVVLSSGGGEAIDISLKCARYGTRRKKIVSVIRAYHGHTGLALGTADGRYADQFMSAGRPDEFVKVPFNDLASMEAALAPGDAACVIMETIPATYGFPMPDEGYLPGVKALCEKYGTLYVADEVQTGLMRCGDGNLWGITGYGVTPDIIVTSKGLSGGLYPIGAVIVNEQAGGWLKEDGWGHISTFGGSELGCVAALKTLEITMRPETISNVDAVAARLRAGLDQIRARYDGFFTGIRQRGVIFGLEFNTHPQGAKHVMRELYQNGVWAIFSQLDPRVLQFKPGLLLTSSECDEILTRTEAGIAAAATSIRSPQNL
jgi:putrescine aminotransferase